LPSNNKNAVPISSKRKLFISSNYSRKIRIY
jgi:hypothetical protein